VLVVAVVVVVVVVVTSASGVGAARFFFFGESLTVNASNFFLTCVNLANLPSCFCGSGDDDA
jgi:hypothetical protein